MLIKKCNLIKNYQRKKTIKNKSKQSKHTETIERGVWRPSIFEEFGDILKIGMSTKELEKIMNETDSDIQATLKIKELNQQLSNIKRIVEIFNIATGLLKRIAPDVDYRNIEKTSVEAHSNQIIVIDQKYLKQNKTDRIYNKFDGMITNLKNVPLICAVADCAVIIGYDPKKQAIMMLHAGWRNILKQISVAGIEKMEQTYESGPKNLLFAISPHLGKKEFEVGVEVYNLFKNTKNKDGSLIYTQEEIKNLFKKNENNKEHYFFNMGRAIKESLIKLSVQKENIQVSKYSTANKKGNKLFHSLRKQGKQDRGSSVCMAVLK